MGLIKFYHPFVGKQSEFEDKFSEDTMEYATAYWNQLDEKCIILVILLAVISLGSCIAYFTVYNNMPGRHYKKTHWLMFYLLQSVVGCGALSYLVAYLIAKPTLDGAGMLIFNIALGNMIYSIFSFGILSVIWWIALPTNAYRLIGKK